MNAISPFLTVREAAARLRLSVSTLNRLRVAGGGPVFLKLGSRVVHRREAVDAWAALHEHSRIGNCSLRNGGGR